MWVQTVFAVATALLDTVVTGGAPMRRFGRAVSVFLIVGAHEAAMLALVPAAMVTAAAVTAAVTAKAPRFVAALMLAAAVYAVLMGTFQIAHGEQLPVAGALAIAGAVGFVAVFRTPV